MNNKNKIITMFTYVSISVAVEAIPSLLELYHEKKSPDITKTIYRTEIGPVTFSSITSSSPSVGVMASKE